MISILTALRYLKDSLSKENYNKIIKILEDETNSGFTEEMREYPESQILRYAKLYLPEGKTHYFNEEFSNEDLAFLINMFFVFELEYVSAEGKQKEELDAINWWLKKEIAYQTINRLVGEKKITCVIQNEKDWCRYFLFPYQSEIEEKN